MSRRIVTLGDSTMQFNNFLKFPQTGWPQALIRFVKPDVEIVNFAVNGKSTKNYIDLGLFENAYEQIQEDDLVLIEFGHNDVKKEDPLRFTEPYGKYKENLRYMVSKCQSKGANVILLTSIIERNFFNNCLEDSRHYIYTKAMLELAEEMKVQCIDMYSLTKEVVQRYGEVKSRQLYMYFDAGLYENYPLGLQDNTHLRYDGAYEVANCFYREMLKRNLCQELFLK